MGPFPPGGGDGHPGSTAPTSRGAGSIERWLLETGRHEINDDLYRAVTDGKA